LVPGNYPESAETQWEYAGSGKPTMSQKQMQTLTKTTYCGLAEKNT